MERRCFGHSQDKHPIPIHIEHPCINIIGATQIKHVHELLEKRFEKNGLLDRILFENTPIPQTIILEEPGRRW